jgi:ribosomal-protein-alanine N-acetyltransferase
MVIEQASNSAPWSERSFRNEVSHPNGSFIVAIEMGDVVGYAGVWNVVDEAHITTVAVAPEHRRQGIGRRLVSELLGRAKESGMICATLEVRASNSGAIELYQKLGFTETARRKGYYPDNKEDAVVMWLYDLQDWDPPRA